MKKPLSEITKTRIWKGTGLASILSLVVVTAWAFNVTWNAPISLVITNIDLKVYWEQNCTTPVTAIDFGNIEQDGQNYYAYLYIRNEGLGTVQIHWNSTRSLVTNDIFDYWEYQSGFNWYNIENLPIAHNAVVTTRYRILVDTAAAPGSYSWTLYLGATQ